MSQDHPSSAGADDAFLTVPALSAPAGFTTHWLPVGHQIVGRHLDGATVLPAGRAFEEATAMAPVGLAFSETEKFYDRLNFMSRRPCAKFLANTLGRRTLT